MRDRRHLFAVAVATLSLQALLPALSVGRVCWPVLHTHRGVAAPDCPMHHHADPATGPGVQQPQHPRHHERGHHAATTPDDAGARLTCACSADAVGMYAAPSGIVPPPATLATCLVVVMLAPAEVPSDLALACPPLSPPPRPSLPELS